MLAHELGRLTAQARAQQFHQVPIQRGGNFPSSPKLPWGLTAPFFLTPQKSRGWLVLLVYTNIQGGPTQLQGGPTQPDISYKWS